MLNQRTRKALEDGEYVTCDCFQAIFEQAQKDLRAGGKSPKLAQPISEILGKTALPFLKYLNEKGRYSTRVSDASRVIVPWAFCPCCGKPLRTATAKDLIFWKAKL